MLLQNVTRSSTTKTMQVPYFNSLDTIFKSTILSEINYKEKWISQEIPTHGWSQLLLGEK